MCIRDSGEPVELTFKEYSLLHFFLEHPEEVLARERIMKAVWDTDDLLTELVTNLCDNAIRYNRPGGHVELSCGTNADGCP